MPRFPASARSSITRETVGSDATMPNTPGWARSRAMSAAQSPPSATVMARSTKIFAGSWMVRERRHGRTPADRCRSRPVIRAVWASNTPPAVEIIDSPPATTGSQGRH